MTQATPGATPDPEKKFPALLSSDDSRILFTDEDGNARWLLSVNESTDGIDVREENNVGIATLAAHGAVVFYKIDDPLTVEEAEIRLTFKSEFTTIMSVIEIHLEQDEVNQETVAELEECLQDVKDSAKQEVIRSAKAELSKLLEEECSACQPMAAAILSLAKQGSLVAEVFSVISS